MPVRLDGTQHAAECQQPEYLRSSAGDRQRNLSCGRRWRQLFAGCGHISVDQHDSHSRFYRPTYADANRADEVKGAMTMKRKSAQRGSSMLEFTLVGIPIIFVLISTFELA